MRRLRFARELSQTCLSGATSLNPMSLNKAVGSTKFGVEIEWSGLPHSATYDGKNIFINYRRDDSSATAGRLHDRLAQEFGRKSLFMDVDNMPAGVDFVAYLNARVDACDLFLAVIGPHWLDATNATGSRRLDDPEDFVVVEIAAALRRGIPVIPVLIDGARVPKSDELPEPLKLLVRRHAVEVRNAQFRRDADALTEKVHEALRIKRLRRTLQVGLAALLLGTPARKRPEGEHVRSREAGSARFLFG
jgi:TIR domain